LIYKKEIDGLRAISIIFVILFHAEIDLFKGGFIGVDIFFVISGYLITGILIKSSLNKQSFFCTLRVFYMRRARRLLPALYLTILLTIFFSFIFLPRGDYEEFYYSVYSTLGFYSNLFFAQNSDYFNVPYFLKPLVHTWSLSIEFQFYLVYPIILLACLKYLNSQKIIFIFVILCITNLAYIQLGGNLQYEYPYLENNITLFNPPNSGTFFFSGSRVWEFLSGAICFLVGANKSKLNSSKLYYLSLFLIFFSLYYFGRDVDNPSINNFIPVIGTCIFLISKPNKGFLSNILSNNIIVGLGLISYSVYLFHFPIFAFSEYFFQDINTYKIDQNFIKTLLILLSIFVGYLSWRYIEKPARNGKNFKNKFFYIYILSFLFLIILINEFGNSYKKNELLLTTDKYNYINFSKNRDQSPLNNDKFSTNYKKKILILGDSQSLDFFKILESNKNLTTKFEFNYFHQEFEIYFLSENDKKAKKFRKNLTDSDAFLMSEYIIFASDYSDKDLISLDSGIKFINKFNKKLIISTMFPKMKNNNPVLTILLKNKNRILSKKEIESRLFLNLRKNEISKKNSFIKKIAKKNNIVIFDRMNLICNSKKGGECSALTEENYLIFYDHRHLTDRGANYISQSEYLKKFFINLK
tara:strand:+ start:534 stop:2450 length:1917 start_codon:yes stop_codon:yes gene_type:complete